MVCVRVLDDLRKFETGTVGAPRVEGGVGAVVVDGAGGAMVGEAPGAPG